MMNTIWTNAVGRVFATSHLDAYTLEALHNLASSSEGMVHKRTVGGWWIGMVADSRSEASEALRVLGTRDGGWLVNEATTTARKGVREPNDVTLSPPDTATEARAKAFCDAMPYVLRKHPRLLPFGRWLINA